MQQRQIVTVLELGWRGGHYVDTTPRNSYLTYNKELNFSNMSGCVYDVTDVNQPRVTLR